MENFVCMLCEIKKYSLEKMLDNEFLLERKNEFYPEEIFGDLARVCEDCHREVAEYYLKK